MSNMCQRSRPRHRVSVSYHMHTVSIKTTNYWNTALIANSS